MEVNETRNCLVTDILLNIKKNRLNTFENGKTQLLNSGGVVKWAYFQKKCSIPLKFPMVRLLHTLFWILYNLKCSEHLLLSQEEVTVVFLCHLSFSDNSPSSGKDSSGAEQLSEDSWLSLDGILCCSYGILQGSECFFGVCFVVTVQLSVNMSAVQL